MDVDLHDEQWGNPLRQLACRGQAVALVVEHDLNLAHGDVLHEDLGARQGVAEVRGVPEPSATRAPRRVPNGWRDTPLESVQCRNVGRDASLCGTAGRAASRDTH